MKSERFWDDSTLAKGAIEELKELKSWIQTYDSAMDRLAFIQEFASEGGEDLQEEWELFSSDLRTLQFKRMLSGELDHRGCTLSIHAGAGGTESCDWVLMLSRMYERWLSKKGWSYEWVERIDGEVAGLKSCQLSIKAPYAYGYCKAEKGVHRLVRISPFDSNKRRHTSFASVEVAPIIDEEIPIEIRDEELKIDTYRSSGAGGQHVNKTDSAVRITHLPTGIVVASQQERSQIQNREKCLKVLKERLYELEVAKREALLKGLSKDQLINGWGSQIRNYVLQPYTLCKDLRTDYETSNVNAVLDGDLDPFIEQYLSKGVS